MLAGCSNASATSEKTPETKENIVANETPATAQKTEEFAENNEVSTSTITNEEVAPDGTKDVDVNWQDYVDSDGVFNMDNYAETLGYSVIKADKSNSWYIFDTVNYHYCVIAYRDTLNIMFDSYDVGYAINVIDEHDHTRAIKQCIQSDVCDVSEEWIQESSSLLGFIISNGPSEEEIRNYSGIKTIHLSCTKWSECFVTDERGVIIDNNGKAEPLWNRNWKND